MTIIRQNVVLPISELVYQFSSKAGIVLDEVDMLELLTQLFQTIDHWSPAQIASSKIALVDFSRLVVANGEQLRRLEHRERFEKAAYELLVQIYARLDEYKLVEPGSHTLYHFPYLMAGADVYLQYLEN